MKKIIWFGWLIMLPACSGNLTSTVAGDDMLPTLVTSEPAEGGEFVGDLRLTFSRTLAEAGLQAGGLMVVATDSLAELAQTNDDILAALDDGDLNRLEGQVVLDDSQNVVTWTASADLSATSYTLVITNRLTSTDNYPFSADPNRGTIPYLANFVVQGADSSTGESSGESADDEVAADPSGDEAGSATGGDAASGTSTEDESATGLDLPLADFFADGVMITEVVSDPQQDWNETSGGNGVRYDAEPGTGKVSSTDEWVEIYNLSPETLDLEGWSLVMNDTTSATEVLGTGNAEFYFGQGGTLSDFSPGEYLVIGNPSGDINNTVDLELLDATGSLAASLAVADANADTVDSESLSILDYEGESYFYQGPATPGFGGSYEESVD